MHPDEILFFLPPLFFPVRVIIKTVCPLYSIDQSINDFSDQMVSTVSGHKYTLAEKKAQFAKVFFFFKDLNFFLLFCLKYIYNTIICCIALA